MILAIAVVAVVVVLVYVMPSIVEMFVMGDAELPGITQFMLKVSDFFKENWRRLFRGDPIPLREDKR